jgi:energy-coupling factor transport system ATP-binding protein
MVSGVRRRPSGLAAAEVCVAAAMADVAAVVCLMLRFVPLGGLSIVLAAFPFAALGDRYRCRVCLAAAVSGSVTGFLLAGPVTANAVSVAALLGSLVGIAHRRVWSWARTLATAAVLLGLPAAALAVTGMSVLSAYRQLAFAQLLSSWAGLARILGLIPAPAVRPLVRAGDVAVTWVVGYWWVWIPAAVVGAVVFLSACARVLFQAPLGAVSRLVPSLAGPRPPPDPPGALVAPLPLRLTRVGVGYPGRVGPVLSALEFSLDRGEFVVVTGVNGAGKSTLARLIAGARPDSGRVSRPGEPGLGVSGGTAMIFQRPECQVLGVRVIDDLVWGAAPGARIDVDGLLERVGLAGMAARETSTLSGGQLQRLAVASLLARDPSVVISDESTAMLDPDGRVLLLGLLRSLAERENKAVVHITHHPEEIAGSHRTVNLGRTPAETAELSPVPDGTSGRGGAGAGGGVAGGAVSVQGLGFAHAAGTPWEHRVLREVDLDVPAGGGLLITGANGSGKSTLAALLSGISAPTEGQVLLDGRPVRNGRDGALLALQYARLQLLRATVGEDVRDAASASREAADAALALLGLPPDLYRERGVDELSVGEQRRVALAGLLACRPRLLILDEPLAGLDQLGRRALVRALAAARASGTTLVVTSHDTAALEDVVDGVVVVEHGRVRRSRLTVEAAVSGRTVTSAPRPTASPATGPAGSAEPERATPRRRGSRPGAAPVLGPRMLPWSSPAHRLWAGTKITVLGLVTVALAADPSWATLLAASVVLGSWALVARVPRSALPRVPRWFTLALLGGGVLVAAGGGAPYFPVLGLNLGMGGLVRWALLLGITALTLFGALLLLWTTALGEVAPLLQGIVRRGRRVPLPIAEWAATVSLGLRLLPILREECATVLTMTSQRVGPAPGNRRDSWRAARDQVVRGIVLCCATAVRRSAEMGDAITARGGLGAVAQVDSGPGRCDALVLVATLAVLAVGILS